MSVGHESEDNVRLWKDSLLEMFGAKETTAGSAELTINLGNAIDTVQTVDLLLCALEKYFADDSIMPDANVKWHLSEMEGHAGDLFEYLTDEGI